MSTKNTNPTARSWFAQAAAAMERPPSLQWAPDLRPVVAPQDRLPCANEAKAKREPRRLSTTAAFYLLASITVSFLAGSSAPTPLYAVYQAQWGFSPITVSVIFGVYAIAVLIALLFGGRLSDHVGRRPVLLVSIAVQIVTMVLFFFAGGVAELLVARVVQGLATGAAVAAIGAGMLDLDRERGSVANAIVPTIGTALGGVLSGVLVQFLPAPTHLVYAVLAVVFVLQAVGVIYMEETITPRGGAVASLKPQFKLPKATREPLLLALPVLVATWALAGFYGALGPMLVRALLGTHSALVGGLALFTLAGSGSIAVLVLQHREPRSMMSLGALSLALGMGLAIAALEYHSVTAFFISTALAGVGFGAGFQGSVRTILPFAAAHERAGVLSLIFIVSYLAMGAPAVVAGVLVAQHGDILGTAQEFGAVVMALALLALLGSVARTVTRKMTSRRQILAS
jgi:MFS family permease